MKLQYIFFFSLSLTPWISLSQQTKTDHDKEKMDYCLSIAKTYCSDAYTILSTDSKGTFVQFIKGETQEDWKKSISTAVHEVVHSMNRWVPRYSPGNNSSLNGCSYFITIYTRIICPITATYHVIELNSMVPKDLQRNIWRYNSYIGDSSRYTWHTLGIFPLMDEFCAYYHGCKADYELRKAGILKTNIYKRYKEVKGWDGKITKQLTESSFSSTNQLDAYYEFKLFISWYLQYAKEKHPEIYRETYNNTNLRITYTLLDDLYKELLQKIKSDPLLSQYYRTVIQDYITDQDYKEMDNFRLKDVTIKNYEKYLVKFN